MSITKAHRQEIRQLKRRQGRVAQRKVLVEGEKCIRELCRSAWTVERIYFTETWEGASIWTSDAHLDSLPRQQVSAKDMEMMSAVKTPPGILAVAEWPSDVEALPRAGGLVLYLDNVADPGNVGTLIRVADWFGLHGVILSPRCADALSPKALHSAMGSTFHISTAVMPFAELPSDHTTSVIGLDAGGKNLFEPGAMSTPSLLVVGSESHGLSSDIKEACHAIASIPGAGRAESLNASVAGAIATSVFLQKGLT